MALKDHLNKLEYFCKMADFSSLQKASQNIGITQPQLSKVIKQLEEDLGKLLIVRTSSGIELTKAGLDLVHSARDIFKQVDILERQIKYDKIEFNGVIKIGTYDSIARYFFPDFIKYLKTTAPKLKVFLETAPSQEILQKIKKKELDLAVVVTEEKKSRVINFKEIYKDSFGLYCHPQLANEFSRRLIYLDFEINETDKAMKTFGFTESILCDNLETVRSLAEQSMGVALLPHRVAREGVFSKKLVEHKHPKIKVNDFDSHSICLCHHKDIVNKEKDFVLRESERFLAKWSAY